MKEITEQEMLHKMAAYCSSVERCVQDIRRKIRLAGLSAEAEERIITRLIQEHFLDERRFAQAFVKDKLRFNQWGRVKIDYELKKKGVSSSSIEEALSFVDEQEYYEVLTTVLKSKQKSVKAKDDRERYYKLLRFAVGKGFTSQEAARCLRSLLTDTDTYEEHLA